MFSKKVIILFTICIYIDVITSAATCGSSVVKKSNPKSVRYSVQFFFKANWHRAYQFCRYIGQQLATVTSDDDLHALKSAVEEAGVLKTKIPLWLSGTDAADDRKFYWASTGRPFTYTNWNLANNEPNNLGGKEHCMWLEGNGLTWNDSECSVEVYFVCEPVSQQ